jgi:hypothetical protein
MESSRRFAALVLWLAGMTLGIVVPAWFFITLNDESSFLQRLYNRSIYTNLFFVNHLAIFVVIVLPLFGVVYLTTVGLLLWAANAVNKRKPGNEGPTLRGGSFHRSLFARLIMFLN